MLKIITLFLLITLSVGHTQDLPIHHYRSGTPYLRVIQRAGTWTCFDQPTLAELAEKNLNYKTMESLIQIDEQKINSYQITDSLENLNEISLKNQNEKLIGKLDTTTALLRDEKIKKWVWAYTSGLSGIVIGIFTLVFVIR